MSDDDYMQGRKDMRAEILEFLYGRASTATIEGRPKLAQRYFASAEVIRREIAA